MSTNDSPPIDREQVMSELRQQLAQQNAARLITVRTYI
jgi:hypothetical protein